MAWIVFLVESHTIVRTHSTLWTSATLVRPQAGGREEGPGPESELLRLLEPPAEGDKRKLGVPRSQRVRAR